MEEEVTCASIIQEKFGRGYLDGRASGDRGGQ
jgi:hypothetical protein